MKVSKKQRDLTRKKLVKAACEIFVEEGYQATSMRKIAKVADVSSASIYRYFANKERIFLAFYSVSAEEALVKTKKIKNYDTLSLQEKIHLLIENYLEELLAEREFVASNYKLTMQTPGIFFKEKSATREVFKPAIKEFIEEAVACGEFEDGLPSDIVAEVSCEFISGIVFFWLKDETEDFDDTSQLIDLSLSLGNVIICSGLMSKITDLFGFFIKSHLHKYVSEGTGILDKLKIFKESILK